MSHWAHLNIWPDEFIALNRETIHHPRLQELLARHPEGEWELKLAQIATYCRVILDGEYLPEELVKLAGILYMKLVLMREDNRGLVVIDDMDNLSGIEEPEDHAGEIKLILPTPTVQ